MLSRNYRLLFAPILITGVVIYLYPLSLPTPLLDPDEGLHASIAQEMVETGDYLIPRYQGEPFRDKPILYFAAQAFSLRLFGMNELAIRLPGFLFALLGVISTCLLARYLFDRETAVVTALVSLTLLVPLALAQVAVHDIALVPWTNLLMLCWWQADRSESRRVRIQLTVASVLLFCLALLTKGLIGLALVSIGYFLFVVISRQLSWSVVTRYSVGFFFGGMLASPWFLAMERSAPGYLFYYFIERHIGGFATADHQHGGEPWFYYLPILLGGTIPWVLYVGHSVWQSYSNRSEEGQRKAKPTTLLLCWLVGGTLFLSIASSKLITYALPLFPVVAILAGHSFQQFFDRQYSSSLDTSFARLFQCVCAVGSIIPLAALAVIDRYQQSTSSPMAYALALMAGIAMLLAIWLVRQEQRQAAVATGSLWFALLFLCLVTWPLQRTALHYSQRDVAKTLATQTQLPSKIILVGERVASFTFYLSPEQRQSIRQGHVEVCHSDDKQYWTQPNTGTLIVINQNKLNTLSATEAEQLRLSSSPVGQYRLVNSSAMIARRKENRKW